MRAPVVIGLVAVAVAVVAGLAACAHTPDLPLRPDATPPLGSTTEVFTARDGTQLLARAWQPTAGRAKASVVIMHGLEDYSAHYAALATQLTAAGCAVYAFDLRGHAHSAGPRVAPADWMDYVDDLDLFLTHVEHRAPGVPVFLFGHSMGGAVATLAAERHAPKLAGLVLSGPLVALDAPPLLVAMVHLLGTLAPRSPTLKFDPHDFSSDPAVVAAMAADDMISHVPAPSSTTAGIVDGVHRIWSGVDALTMPILDLHGTHDLLTAPSGSRALIERAPATDKTLRIYDGAFHILLAEPNGVGARVASDILAWLDAHTGGTAVPAPPVYTGALAGNPRGWTQAVEATVGMSPGAFAGSFALNVARPEPIGWHAALTARMAGDDYKAVALRPVGLAVRAGSAVVGVSAGGAVVTGAHLAVSSGGWLELPAGPLHLGAAAEWARRVTGSSGAGPLSGDLFWLSGSVRLGRDLGYWPGAHAGVGPVLSGGAVWVGGAASAVFATVGVQLYGAD